MRKLTTSRGSYEELVPVEFGLLPADTAYGYCFYVRPVPNSQIILFDNRGICTLVGVNRLPRIT